MPNPVDLDKLAADLAHIDGDSPCDHIRCMYAIVDAVPGLIAEVKRLRAEQLVCDQALLRIREHADITALIAKRASELRKAAR